MSPAGFGYVSSTVFPCLLFVPTTSFQSLSHQRRSKVVVNRTDHAACSTSFHRPMTGVAVCYCPRSGTLASMLATHTLAPSAVCARWPLRVAKKNQEYACAHNKHSSLDHPSVSRGLCWMARCRSLLPTHPRATRRSSHQTRDISKCRVALF